MLIHQQAWGACTPDLTQTDQTTTCSGLDADGIVITTSGSTLNVPIGGTITSAGAPAISVAMPITEIYATRTATIQIDGVVAGGAYSGISVAPGPLNGNLYDLRGSAVRITIGASGVVSGTVGIATVASPGNSYAGATIALDNSGSVSGNTAVRTEDNYGLFASILNREGGVINGIAGRFIELDNQGTIDGGSGAALSSPQTYFYNPAITRNSGLITSVGAVTTLTSGIGYITNTGTISNTGAGATVDGTSIEMRNEANGTIISAQAGTMVANDILSLENRGIVNSLGSAPALTAPLVQVTNEAGGIIAANGVVISAPKNLRLTNTGVITGDVLTGFGSYSYYYSNWSTVDTADGVLDGDLQFGRGNDVLYARYMDGSLQTGVTGAIDGGAGVDLLTLRISADTTIATPLPMPSNFENIGIEATSGTRIVLGSGFSNPGSLILSGGGTIESQAALSVAGPVVTGNGFNNSLEFVNSGSITDTSFGSGFAVGGSFAAFTNSGRIVSAEGGFSASIYTFENSGEIIATNTAVSASLNGLPFTNSGLIQSTAGTGLQASSSSFTVGYGVKNTGTIEGATVGANLGTNLINDGIIRSAGTAVRLGYGTLENRSGGLIEGGQQAISIGYTGTVANAGTINGNVSLEDSFGYGSVRFFALEGGVLNGNLALGKYTTFVTEFVGAGSSGFAGVNGNVTSSGGSVRLRVRDDATASITPMAGFSSVGYDLYDGAALTLSASDTITQQLVFAGSGSVDLNANVVASMHPAIFSDTALDWASYNYGPNDLSIVSHGAITLIRSDPVWFANAIQLREGDVFTNAGTITVRDMSNSTFNGIAAVSGGQLINTGTITVENAQAFSGTQSVDNSGTVTGNGPLSRYLSGPLTNSGTLASTNGAALQLTSTTMIDNQAGGTISGSAGIAIQASGGTVRNAGTINGSVDLAYSNFGFPFAQGSYVADGGTLNGNLRFGRNDDLLIETGCGFGVTGRIDGGDGFDVAVHQRSATGNVELLGTLPTRFEGEAVTALGTDTIVTISGSADRSADILVGGDGQIVNRAATSGGLRTLGYTGYYLPYPNDARLTSFDNQADIGGQVIVSANIVLNSANIGSVSAPVDSPDSDEMGIEQSAYGTLSFTNSGSVITMGGNAAVDLSGYALSTASIVNSGTLLGGLSGGLQFAADAPSPAASFSNSGTIKSDEAGESAVALYQYQNYYSEDLTKSLTIDVTNNGVIEQSGSASNAISLGISSPGTVMILNTGAIRANAGGVSGIYTNPYYQYISFPYTDPAVAIDVGAHGPSSQVAITNTASGSIEAKGALSIAVMAEGKLVLSNAGVIDGGGDFTTTDPDDILALYRGTNRFAGAIQTFGDYDDRIDNSGAITGSVDLGDGNDTIVNTGTMTGNIRLGLGNDVFIQRISGTVTGAVSGGEGFDTFRVDATGTGAIGASQLNGFEQLVQSGSGSATWSGSFDAPTIELDASTLVVASGATLQTADAVTIAGGSGAETVSNAGTINGSVLLGDGGDIYRDLPGSIVGGSLDGGAGQDSYAFVLAGNRTATNAGINFENLDVSGNGTLTYILNQSFAQARLEGAGLDLILNGNAIGEVSGGAEAETVSVDGDLARVALAGGDDRLVIGNAQAAGIYEGGAGNDRLTFANTAPVTLSGTATGFEKLEMGSNALIVLGTLGTPGETVTLTDAPEVVTLANGGTIAASLNLGAGADRFRLQGGAFSGMIDGGAGEDIFSVETGTPYVLTDAVRGFERFSMGGSALTISSTLDAAGDVVRFDNADDVITVAAGGSIAGTVDLGGGNNRLTIAGTFNGSVNSGAGIDALIVNGGSQTAALTFASIANVERYDQSGGFATISGTAALGAGSLTGGRLVGLANSTINAGMLTVQQGATFGSAGTVNANLDVAGMLSPGASPGTMTVNGNVSLGATSVSLFEITPTVSDKLVISGTLSIASGASLQLAPTETIQPGRTLDLIVVGSSISGSFTNVVKPDSLFGIVVHSANKIQLLGQFLSDPSFSPQVQASIAYTNATLITQPSTSTLFSALPSLAPGGVSDAAAFARLTPEPYASAVQASVQRGLIVARAARTLNFAPTGEDTPHAFTFAQVLGDWSRIDASVSRGTARATSNGYGFLGGIGFAAREWAIGGFVGYLNEDQTISALGARTKVDGVTAGMHLRYDKGAFAASGSVFYDGASGDTERVLPAGGSAQADYNLRGLGFDAKIAARLQSISGLALIPQIGTTWIRTRRSGTVEGGSSPFALTVAADRQWAGFVDASLKIEADAVHGTLRPWITLGAHYQLQGRNSVAVAGFAGGALNLVAAGASRARLAGTIEAGLSAPVAPGIDLFVSGNADFAARTNGTGINGSIKVFF